jgi:hypothetical protein
MRKENKEETQEGGKMCFLLCPQGNKIQGNRLRILERMKAETSTFEPFMQVGVLSLEVTNAPEKRVLTC